MSSFGTIVRNRRQEKEITLRRFAEMVGVSPTFISKMERGDFPPPSEAKIKAIARALNLDSDALLAEAGKFSSDLGEVIQDNPVEMATFLRTIRGMSANDILELAQTATRMKHREE